MNTAPLALLVDDNTDSVEMYATYLRHIGFRVTSCASAAEGFSRSVGEEPDVVVADIRLPGGPDGLTLATQLRLDHRTRHIGIIVLTGDAYPADRVRAIAAGCDVFLTKPCLPTVLAEHARSLLAA